MKKRRCENCGEKKAGKMLRIRRGTYRGCRVCSRDCGRELLGWSLAAQMESRYYEAKQMGLTAL